MLLRAAARWSRGEQKLRAVTEAAALSERELGELLRREGLHEAQLGEWRKAAPMELPEQGAKIFSSDR
ncbi:transposase [Sorangium sp. So ce1504]|uniref:transposase n=1 Tax=Sorangium sp. So ce1504 TaxID=3133337 RepID=UPI003F5F4F67